MNCLFLSGTQECEKTKLIWHYKLNFKAWIISFTYSTKHMAKTSAFLCYLKSTNIIKVGKIWLLIGLKNKSYFKKFCLSLLVCKVVHPY